MGTDKGLCGLGFSAEQGEDAVRADLAARWPGARIVEDPQRWRPWSRRPLAGGGGRGST
jgi:AraC family transcriptional regulator of adaptative response/methylated-DNA-[protein]-cysteine methyltransferase